jgi:hypothetical protein
VGATHHGPCDTLRSSPAGRACRGLGPEGAREALRALGAARSCGRGESARAQDRRRCLSEMGRNNRAQNEPATGDHERNQMRRTRPQETFSQSLNVKRPVGPSSRGSGAITLDSHRASRARRAGRAGWAFGSGITDRPCTASDAARPHARRFSEVSC